MLNHYSTTGSSKTSSHVTTHFCRTVCRLCATVSMQMLRGVHCVCRMDYPAQRFELNHITFHFRFDESEICKTRVAQMLKCVGGTIYTSTYKHVRAQIRPPKMIDQFTQCLPSKWHERDNIGRGIGLVTHRHIQIQMSSEAEAPPLDSQMADSCRIGCAIKWRRWQVLLLQIGWAGKVSLMYEHNMILVCHTKSDLRSQIIIIVMCIICV